MAQDTARSVDGGGAVDLESYLWPDTGTEPNDTADAAYAAYDEPIAGYDNDANHSVTWDIGALNYETGALKDRVSTLEDDLATLENDLTSLEDSFGTHNHDSRYYKQSEATDRFVDEAGDTMTGTLAHDSEVGADASFEAIGNTSRFSITVQDGNGRASQYWNVESGTQNIIEENEGAAWWFLGRGEAHIDLYDGVSGDAGTTPDWTRVLNATTDGVELGAGATLGDDLDAGGNPLHTIRAAHFEPEGNDVMRLADGSGGDEEGPYIIRYDTRDLRLWSGSSGVAMEWELGGNVNVPNGDLVLDQSSASIRLGGDNAGPHMIDFGDSDSGDSGLNIVWRTAPDLLTVEQPDGSRLWWTDKGSESVDYRNTNYVVLPVRSGAPSNPPSGATWIET